MQRIGILGGTFDPVHFGHLRPAVEVRAALGFDQVRLIPARVSPLRDSPGASGADRLAMLRAAAEGEPDLVVDERELERPGPSYTIDTLESLAAEFPGARLYFIMGADAFASFERWYRWPEILTTAHLVVTTRPEAALTIPPAVAEAVTDDPAELERAAAGLIHAQGVTALDISATAIRRTAAAGGDLRYLMPEGARRYLEQHRLYSPESAARERARADGNRSAG
ncbi:MAG: nicotinate-nucleotide adenylyltransferase [Halofilum sp. (in: g-proteobacteria)]